jgi:hypothetical protein
MAETMKSILRDLFILHDVANQGYGGYCIRPHVFIIPQKHRSLFEHTKDEYFEDFRPAGLVWIEHDMPVLISFDLHGFLYRLHARVSFQDVDAIRLLQLELLQESR